MLKCKSINKIFYYYCIKFFEKKVYNFFKKIPISAHEGIKDTYKKFLFTIIPAHM